MLIRKYLNGELDARAMHQLEKRAQEDPFLMDALEGYEKVAGDQQPQLDELNERLHRRINKKEKRIIPWRFLSIAASVLIITTIGGLLFFMNQPSDKQKIAANIFPVKESNIDVDSNKRNLKKPDALASLKQKPQPKPLNKAVTTTEKSNLTASNTATAIGVDKPVDTEFENNAATRDTTRLREVTVLGYSAQRKKDITGSVTTISPGYLSNVQPDSASSKLAGRVAGVSIADNKKLNFSLKGHQKTVINGRVIGKDDGLPIAGASVKIAGTNKGAVTDINGKFSLDIDSGKTDKLVIGFIGYVSREVLASKKDSLKAIALEPAGSSLSEVVVIGYGAKKRDTEDNPLVIDSRPANGWSDFRKYIKQNAISPDGRKGVVKLSFMVDHRGNISDISVTKSLSAATDQKAIDLLNNGPSWLGSTSGNPEKVTIRIRFSK